MQVPSRESVPQTMQAIRTVVPRNSWRSQRAFDVTTGVPQLPQLCVPKAPKSGRKTALSSASNWTPAMLHSFARPPLARHSTLRRLISVSSRANTLPTKSVNSSPSPRSIVSSIVQRVTNSAFVSLSVPFLCCA